MKRVGDSRSFLALLVVVLLIFSVFLILSMVAAAGASSADLSVVVRGITVPNPAKSFWVDYPGSSTPVGVVHSAVRCGRFMFGNNNNDKGIFSNFDAVSNVPADPSGYGDARDCIYVAGSTKVFNRAIDGVLGFNTKLNDDYNSPKVTVSWADGKAWVVRSVGAWSEGRTDLLLPVSKFYYGSLVLEQPIHYYPAPSSDLIDNQAKYGDAGDLRSIDPVLFSVNRDATKFLSDRTHGTGLITLGANELAYPCDATNAKLDSSTTFNYAQCNVNEEPKTHVEYAYGDSEFTWGAGWGTSTSVSGTGLTKRDIDTKIMGSNLPNVNNGDFGSSGPYYKRDYCDSVLGPYTLQESTSYMGLSYVHSTNPGVSPTSTGCDIIFDGGSKYLSSNIAYAGANNAGLAKPKMILRYNKLANSWKAGIIFDGKFAPFDLTISGLDGAQKIGMMRDVAFSFGMDFKKVAGPFSDTISDSSSGSSFAYSLSGLSDIPFDGLKYDQGSKTLKGVFDLPLKYVPDGAKYCSSSNPILSYGNVVSPGWIVRAVINENIDMSVCGPMPTPTYTVPPCSDSPNNHPNSKQYGVCKGTHQSCDKNTGIWKDDYSSKNVNNYESPELSCDGLDNDCDGYVDNDGAVFARSGVSTPLTRKCYTGSADTKNIGECVEGTQSCVAPGWESSLNSNTPASCVGEVKPGTETCNGKDDDCDSLVDDFNGFTTQTEKDKLCELPASATTNKVGKCLLRGDVTSCVFGCTSDADCQLTNRFGKKYQVCDQVATSATYQTCIDRSPCDNSKGDACSILSGGSSSGCSDPTPRCSGTPATGCECKAKCDGPVTSSSLCPAPKTFDDSKAPVCTCACKKGSNGAACGVDSDCGASGDAVCNTATCKCESKYGSPNCGNTNLDSGEECETGWRDPLRKQMAIPVEILFSKGVRKVIGQIGLPPDSSTVSDTTPLSCSMIYTDRPKCDYASCKCVGSSTSSTCGNGVKDAGEECEFVVPLPLTGKPVESDKYSKCKDQFPTKPVCSPPGSQYGKKTGCECMPEITISPKEECLKDWVSENGEEFICYSDLIGKTATNVQFAGYCGDGKKDAEEDCDLGSEKNIPGSGCNSDCTKEESYCFDKTNFIDKDKTIEVSVIGRMKASSLDGNGKDVDFKISGPISYNGDQTFGGYEGASVFKKFRIAQFDGSVDVYLEYTKDKDGNCITIAKAMLHGALGRKDMYYYGEEYGHLLAGNEIILRRLYSDGPDSAQSKFKGVNFGIFPTYSSTDKSPANLATPMAITIKDEPIKCTIMNPKWRVDVYDGLPQRANGRNNKVLEGDYAITDARAVACEGRTVEVDIFKDDNRKDPSLTKQVTISSSQQTINVVWPVKYPSGASGSYAKFMFGVELVRLDDADKLGGKEYFSSSDDNKKIWVIKPGSGSGDVKTIAAQLSPIVVDKEKLKNAPKGVDVSPEELGLMGSYPIRDVPKVILTDEQGNKREVKPEDFDVVFKSAKTDDGKTITAQATIVPAPGNSESGGYSKGYVFDISNFDVFPVTVKVDDSATVVGDGLSLFSSVSVENAMIKLSLKDKNAKWSSEASKLPKVPSTKGIPAGVYNGDKNPISSVITPPTTPRPIDAKVEVIPMADKKSGISTNTIEDKCEVLKLINKIQVRVQGTIDSTGGKISVDETVDLSPSTAKGVVLGFNGGYPNYFGGKTPSSGQLKYIAIGLNYEPAEADHTNNDYLGPDYSYTSSGSLNSNSPRSDIMIYVLKSGAKEGQRFYKMLDKGYFKTGVQQTIDNSVDLKFTIINNPCVSACTKQSGTLRYNHYPGAAGFDLDYSRKNFDDLGKDVASALEAAAKDITSASTPNGMVQSTGPFTPAEIQKIKDDLKANVKYRRASRINQGYADGLGLCDVDGAFGWSSGGWLAMTDEMRVFDYMNKVYSKRDLAKYFTNSFIFFDGTDSHMGGIGTGLFSGPVEREVVDLPPTVPCYLNVLSNGNSGSFNSMEGGQGREILVNFGNNNNPGPLGIDVGGHWGVRSRIVTGIVQLYTVKLKDKSMTDNNCKGLREVIAKYVYRVKTELPDSTTSTNLDDAQKKQLTNIIIDLLKPNK